MALDISAWSIRKPIPPLVFFVVLIVLGVVSLQTLPITQMPNIDIPIVTITITQTGAAPSELETQVTKSVENAASGVVGVKHITSSISDGVSVTTVEFQLETPADRAVNDVRNAMANIRSELPQSIEEPSIQRVEVEGMAIVTYAASIHSQTAEQVSWFVDDVIAGTLQGVRGVAQVKRAGGVDREIRVSLLLDRLMALGITAPDVNEQLRATNVDLAGGRGEVGSQEQTIRMLAGAATVEELANRTIVLPGGRKTRLKEIATVTDGGAEARSFASLNGQPVVAFSIYRAKGFSDVTVAEAVANKLQTLTNDHPELSVSEIDSTVRYTKTDYRATMQTLAEGAILAVVVVLIFLRDLRATAISVLAIPLSILPTFWAMDILGFSLNAVSLLAITLVTGILVDDAIVEIENIVRHMRMGKSAYRASLQAADQIGLAVVATTMTIVAMFMPVSFMGGIAGQYFKQFGLTVAIAVTFSLLVARLITPLLAAYFLCHRQHCVEGHGVIMRRYLRMLEWSLRHRFITLALGALIFLGSIMIAGSLPYGFLPTNDLSRSVLLIELPPGATIADTLATADRITALLKERPEVRNVYAVGGAAGANGLSVTAGEVRKTTIIIDLVARSNRSHDQKAFERDMRATLSAIPDIRYSFGNGGGGREFTLILSGPNGAAVEQAALAVEREARQKVSVLANVVSTAALARPEIRIVPRLEEAADLGITEAQIAEAARIATVGDVSANLAKFSVIDRQVPIRVQLDERARGDLSTLDTLRIKAKNGTTVPLATVADTGFGEGPTTIERYDRKRRVAIEADLVGSAPLGEAIEQVMALPSARNLPAGVTISRFGDSEIMEEVFSSFSRAIAAGVLMVLAVLVLLFADAMQPITIIFSMPLSIGGAFLALLLTGNAINLSVIIGFLMLMGIVTKNAILLVDFAITEVAGGVERTQALIEAGRKRAQPVIMTTAAMTAGMVPSALGIGEGGAFRSPMAIALIGGLLASTFLSLVFVPAAFTIMDDFGRILGSKLSRLIGPKRRNEMDGDEPA
ncbi:hydrophobic/amphiphilic exporter-1, HAE1 family [Bradyrhizobium lablabi]|uniref:Hydrophobic/amphiphilic exporter-1, HAE1 family n=1 Tax=Bradyrhizobium lablabi TaxID=722472 RepID=A0A1M7CIU5_9BRAD|nr:efflux RND transporter permease subunit [Bradyrhizobium lablabi]SHL67106.1 hydrophobic/amphiphilic exporter-1, HAE1 family [Bradyrhizobium lablabi]